MSKSGVSLSLPHDPTADELEQYRQIEEILADRGSSAPQTAMALTRFSTVLPSYNEWKRRQANATSGRKQDSPSSDAGLCVSPPLHHLRVDAALEQDSPADPSSTLSSPASATSPTSTTLSPTVTHSPSGVHTAVEEERSPRRRHKGCGGCTLV